MITLPAQGLPGSKIGWPVSANGVPLSDGTGRKSPRCAFAVDPAFSGKSAVTIRQQFLSRDVVADEVHERALYARNNFLKRFEYERVDEQMIQRREVRAERQVIEVGIGLGR